MTKLFAAVALLAPVTMALAQQAAAPASAPAAADPNRVVLQVGDDKMTEKELTALVGPQFAAIPPTHKARIAEQIVQLKLLAQEAKRRGLENDPRVLAATEQAMAQARLATQQAMAQVLVEAASKPDDEATLKAKYDADKSQFEQVRARHILVRAEGSPAPLTPGKKELTDAEAKAKASEIRDRVVNKKEDFATVAKAESDEPAAKTSGGDLGFFTHGRMAPPFEAAAFALKAGETSEPVKTEFGWHIIQTQEHKIPTFDEVKADEAQQGGRKVSELLAKLKASTEVKMDDAFFKASASQPAMPGMPAGHPPVPGAGPGAK